MRGATTASDLLLHGHLDGSTSVRTLTAVVKSTTVDGSQQPAKGTFRTAVTGMSRAMIFCQIVCDKTQAADADTFQILVLMLLHVL